MRRQVAITQTNQWAERTEKLGARLWPTEKLSVEEIGRRLLLEHETRFRIRLTRVDSG